MNYLSNQHIDFVPNKTLNKKDAQAFIEKTEIHPKRFVWCILKNGKEVESL